MLKNSVWSLLAAGGSFLAVGCIGTESEFQEFDREQAQVTEHAHEHGPNGGDLIEVGDHDIHAEVLFHEAENEVEIYLLGPDAKTPAPVALESVTIGFKHGDESENFTLAAAALEGEAEGTASHFVIVNEELFHEFHEHSDGATLTFSVNGKDYSGPVHHHHDHGSHDDHAHGEHADGDHEAHGEAEHAGKPADSGDVHAGEGAEKSAEAATDEKAADAAPAGDQ